MNKSAFRDSGTLQGVTENMQILTGQRGDRLDKALTLRDAAALGMINLRRNGSGVVAPELPPVEPTDPEWSGVQPPVAPMTVTADGAFHTITLTWDIPAYKGHSYAEILRAEVDNPANAAAIGTTLANVYADAVGKGFEAYYWVRFINKNGQVGPLHSTAGVWARTNPDVDEIIASATRFAIYNPAKPTEREIIFGVTDEGTVAIREAVIKAATIQIIHSEKITADYVKAGVSISSPLITGGQIDMGNAFMAGGSAGFGLGGPYAAWDKGWHSIIYSDGSIYTNRLQAEGGYVKNMAIDNCVIGEDCKIYGTLSADRIVGDVVKVVAMANAPDQTITIPAWKQGRMVVVNGIEITAKGGSRNSGGDAMVDSDASAECKITVNGQVRSVSVAASGPYSENYRSAGMVLNAPANAPVTIRVQITGKAELGASWWFDMLGAVVMCFIQGDQV